MRLDAINLMHNLYCICTFVSLQSHSVFVRYLKQVCKTACLICVIVTYFFVLYSNAIDLILLKLINFNFLEKTQGQIVFTTIFRQWNSQKKKKVSYFFYWAFAHCFVQTRPRRAYSWPAMLADALTPIPMSRNNQIFHRYWG